MESFRHIPRATYRLQFNEHFRLANAQELVPYLHDLGISHVYASPLFLATPHSAHGYDVCDFSRLNPELGTEADLEKLAAVLRGKKMGLILDIVPNHMGITSPANGWWWDVLAKGEKSRHAACFDIEWRSADKTADGKILAPVLGDHFDVVLKRGELRVLRENDGFVLSYHEHRFPLSPATTARLPAEPKNLEKLNADFAALGKLIRRQNYRLVFHERGDIELNYRRFFAVSTLAAVRVEDEEVFQATHALIRRWYEKAWLDGVRVDHPDGLREPENYLRRLREILPDGWIVVEKILGPGEQLPATWPVAGTTGYDFLNQVNGLFVDPAAEKTLTEFYAAFTAETTDYKMLVREKKRSVLETKLVAELNRVTASPARVAARSKLAGKFSTAELRAALVEIMVRLPVYRSYLPGGTGVASEEDAVVIKRAVHLASEEQKSIAPEAFTFIHSVFFGGNRRGLADDFIARFQQMTGAVMAKGVEDSAFYCFNRFVSLNEVGGDPSKFGVRPDEFHRSMQRRQKNWPHSQLTTSTHDTKRAEDVRARLNALSEIPELWTQTVARWSVMNACHRRDDFPDRNAEYLYYQTLVGSWPLSVDRAQFYMDKAAHESEQHTTWTKRNSACENALQNFVSETLHDPQFTTDLDKFVGTLATGAATNSLAQTLLKLTAPGVPDIYQGCEIWDWSLVDPDNRRPVDFKQRQRLLDAIKMLAVETIWDRRAEGLPKMFVIQRALKLRERHPRFSEYRYEPLFAWGVESEHLVAFVRGGRILTVVPRLSIRLNNNWHELRIQLPEGEWRDEFSGGNVAGETLVADLFKRFPVALLVKQEGD